MSVLRRAPAAFLLLALAACAVHPPPSTLSDAASWAAVAALTPGMRVRVWWLDSSVANVPQMRSDGTVAATDTAWLDLDTRTGRRRLGRPQVTRVDIVLQQKAADPLGNGVLIGGAIGAAYGGFLLSSFARSSDADSAHPLLFVMTTAAGAAVGGLVDALIRKPEYRTVYRTERRRR